VIVDINPPVGSQQQPYSQQQRGLVEISLIEALNWLEVNGLLLPAPGINGTNGFRVFSRRGQTLLEREQFDSFQRAAAFPKALHHGPFADEFGTLERLGAFADGAGVARSGPHHEIHLDAFTRQTPQDALRTILRDPVA
jgi:hypothetical protein